MKKTWEKPKLIVLVRGKPEESLILSCKGGNLNDPFGSYTYCYRVGDGCMACVSYSMS